MNPENVGHHIPLRHSMLWRKPLLYEKPVLEKARYCHLQLNESKLFLTQWEHQVSHGGQGII